MKIDIHITTCEGRHTTKANQDYFHLIFRLKSCFVRIFNIFLPWFAARIHIYTRFQPQILLLRLAAKVHMTRCKEYLILKINCLIFLLISQQLPNMSADIETSLNSERFSHFFPLGLIVFSLLKKIFLWRQFWLEIWWSLGGGGGGANL